MLDADEFGALVAEHEAGAGAEAAPEGGAGGSAAGGSGSKSSAKAGAGGSSSSGQGKDKKGKSKDKAKQQAGGGSSDAGTLPPLVLGRQLMLADPEFGMLCAMAMVQVRALMLHGMAWHGLAAQEGMLSMFCAGKQAHSISHYLTPHAWNTSSSRQA